MEVQEVEEDEIEEHSIPRETQEVQEQPEQEVLILPGTIEVEIESDFMTPWWEGFVRDIDIIIPECSPTCSASEIDEALGPPYSYDNWRAVLVGRVLYVHSGYGILYGPELGDFLKRMHKAGNTYSLRLGDIWYTQKANIVLGREEVGGSVNLAELFDIEQGDIFILTCWYGHSTGSDTPKLIEHLTLTNR